MSVPRSSTVHAAACATKSARATSGALAAITATATCRQRPESEWMLISVPAIITPQEHAQAKAALSRNKSRSKRNTKEFYLLAGLLRCGYENRETGERCGMTLGCHVQRRVRPEIAREHRCTRAYVSDGHK